MSSKLPQPVHDLLLSAHLLWDIGANSVYAWRIHRVLSVRFLPLGRSPAGKSLLSKNLLRSAITAVSVEVPSLLGRRRVALIFLNYLRVRNAFSEYDRVRHKAQSSFEELLCEVRRFNDHSDLISLDLHDDYQHLQRFEQSKHLPSRCLHLPVLHHQTCIQQEDFVVNPLECCCCQVWWPYGPPWTTLLWGTKWSHYR